MEDLLKSYFQSKGMQPILNFNSQSSKGKQFIFSGEDGHKTLVEVLSEEELRDRNAVLSLVLKSSSSIKIANEVYVALPKLYASVVDAEVLQQSGLGLITYDERRMEEAVAPQFFEHECSTPKPIIQEDLTRNLQYLKNRLSSLEETVQMLTAEMSELKSKPVRQTPTKTMVLKGERTQPPSSDLPSFMRDNPWVDILSRRGAEPQSYAS